MSQHDTFFGSESSKARVSSATTCCFPNDKNKIKRLDLHVELQLLSPSCRSTDTDEKKPLTLAQEHRWKNYISIVTVTFLNSGLSKTRTCQPNNQPGSNTVEKSPSRWIILHWMNVCQNHLLVVESWHRTLHFYSIEERPSGASLPLLFILHQTDWLVNGTCWEKKHIVWPASKKKKAVQRPH